MDPRLQAMFDMIDESAPAKALHRAAVATGAYRDPNRSIGQTLYDAAAGAMMAAPAEGGEMAITARRPAITAYHGSPHDFTAFDASKIGSGEGAQAFGRGMYFAENEKVAHDYRANLARPDFTRTKSGVPISSDMQRILEDSYNDAINNHGVKSPSPNDSVFLARQNLNRQSADAAKSGDFDWYSKVADQSAELARIEKDLPTMGGKTYQVEIGSDPDHFLQWEKPINQQSQHVQDAITNNPNFLDLIKSEARDRAIASTDRSRQDQLYDMVKDPTKAPGEFLIHSAGNSGQEQIANDLHQAGIPGIRYLDQGSRTYTDQPTNNYVVFDPSTISIMRKYGLISAGGLGAAAAATTQNQADQ